MILRWRNKVIGKVENETLKKEIDESKHLLWLAGGVPAIDAGAWDFFYPRIKKFVAEGKTKIYSIGAEIFNANKKPVDFGWGRQYYCQKGLWEIKNKEICPSFKPAMKEQGRLNLFTSVSTKAVERK